MKKGLLIVALIALLAVPMTAMAGMWAITDTEMEDVTGQAGLNIDMTVSMTTGYISYGDQGGGTSYTTTGYLNMTTVKVDDGSGGTMLLSGLTIDVGNNGSASAIVIGMPAVSGRIDIGAIKLGTASGTGGSSIGSLTIGDITTTASTIMIKAN